MGVRKENDMKFKALAMLLAFVVSSVSPDNKADIIKQTVEKTKGEAIMLNQKKNISSENKRLDAKSNSLITEADMILAQNPELALIGNQNPELALIGIDNSSLGNGFDLVFANTSTTMLAATSDDLEDIRSSHHSSKEKTESKKVSSTETNSEDKDWDDLSVASAEADDEECDDENCIINDDYNDCVINDGIIDNLWIDNLDCGGGCTPTENTDFVGWCDDIWSGNEDDWNDWGGDDDWSDDNDDWDDWEEDDYWDDWSDDYWEDDYDDYDDWYDDYDDYDDWGDDGGYDDWGW